MTAESDSGSDPGKGLQQGDIVSLATSSAEVAGIDLQQNQAIEVAILSQTCDVVQPGRTHCLVAPITAASSADVSAAKSGKKPLLLHLDDGSGNGPWVANIGLAFSVRKSQLSEGRLISRPVGPASEEPARRLSARIGRAFSRFPFPDEVYPVFARLQDQLRAKAGKQGNLGRTIDLVEEIRVSADQWGAPGRHLRLHIVVSNTLLIPQEDADPTWAPSRISGLQAHEDVQELALDRVCELILGNIGGDLTTLLHLWRYFSQTLHTQLIAPYLGPEVERVAVDICSDIDFTYFDMKRSESLDLETLSDSRKAAR